MKKVLSYREHQWEILDYFFEREKEKNLELSFCFFASKKVAACLPSQQVLEAFVVIVYDLIRLLEMWFSH